MKVFVDADACPVIDDVVSATRRSNHEVILVHNRHHDLSYGENHVTTYETGDRSDAADHFIFNNVSETDLVVTDDLGLAALVLSQGARILRFRGDRPTSDDIEMRLSMKEASRRQRVRSKRVTGPSEYTERDRKRFLKELETIFTEK